MDTKMIGSKIAKARKDKNMSQAQLAQLLFISPQAVGKWERAESIPDIVTVNRLAEILGLDLNYFSEQGQPVPGNLVVKPTGDHDPTREGPEAVPAPAADERQLLVDFNGGNLAGSDFAGVTAPKRKFNGSALRGSDFAGADLAGSSFTGSDAREANFDGANLADCTFSANDLSQASFRGTTLVRTVFNASGLAGATFADTELVDVKLTKTDLRQTVFENCGFKNVDFRYSDMRGLCLDGLRFTGVKFDKTALDEATFNNATLQQVSFRPSYALTNKYYRAIKTINFDGARMDKLTYAELKGMGADLSKVSFL
ncbi:pentapeptide repeat-containing protein [Taibaiella chishuiensis]|uniref:Uncharacterized protein YjbI with pentapeptide repeats n=1 Tax=Taibaiella chishuiensis TaxID=1434707 RepID=A0A2P8D1Z7_9BACT|nr:pentapeptide repeat-containing protein [Taibaiella chishuiensis]PSK91245.1 uncharacterized protein YjbI with pentapeptide repeats [Taibaiella chishuiensis]